MIWIFVVPDRQTPGNFQRYGTRSNISVQELLKDEESKANKVSEEKASSEINEKKPAPGAVKLPGAESISSKNNKEEDEAEALLDEFKSL